MKIKIRGSITVYIFLLLCLSINAAMADDTGKKVKIDEEDDVVLVLKPTQKQAEYKANVPVKYILSVKNNLKEAQSGKITYAIANFDWTGKIIKEMPVSLASNSSRSISLELPARATGIYHIEVFVNLTEYDDTLRKVCVVDPRGIRSKYARPADFDQFWSNTKADLAKVQPQYKITERPELAKNDLTVYLFEMKSFGDVTVRGWLTIPKGKKNQKWPVWIGLPGYQIESKPIYGANEMAVLTLDVRGQGMSKDVISVANKKDFINLGIEDKNTYVYRGVLMDCIRAIDFACSRPNLDSEAISVTGGSAGGFLALALVSLDNRVTLCSADNPVFSDWRSLVGKKEWPMSDIEAHAKKDSSLPQVLNTLDYFDLKNFVSNIKCPVLMGIGLLDPLAPPYNSYIMYNNIPGDKIMHVYPDLTHEIPAEHAHFASYWMMDHLGLY
ncbi:MAG: hypothetical protein EOP47_16640 [Sphingobacteriaceae bacterium]|nr:MAG: hypothetical protein EOP47_16640 [Sphingobacteriaceae bacterium]